MDTKWLSRTHQLLHILMMSQRPILQVDAGLLASNLMTMLVDRIQQELIHLVDQISHKIASPVLDRIQDIPDADWNNLFACPLIRNLVDCILLAVDNLINVNMEILPELTLRWDAQFGDSMQDRWMVINTRRKIQVLLATLDQVMAALESGLLCAEDSGTYTDESLRRLAGGIPEMPHIELAPEEISRYFRDTGPVVVTHSMPGAVRDSVPPIGDSIVHTGIKGENDEPMTPRRCREVFEEILRSMEE